ncbi:hypothetical protein ACLOJK_002588 [Asimina triloba]
MKGITHGACDYLLKPVRIEELKNIWQHVIRRRKVHSHDKKNTMHGDDGGKLHNGVGEGGQDHVADGKHSKKRKDQIDEDDDDCEENGHGNEDLSTQKKPRVVWSVELHRKFVAAVNQLGIDKAVPKKILELMNVEKLTRENVASHLQKYRLYLKRISSMANQQANINAVIAGKDLPYLPMGTLDALGDFHALAGSRQLTSPGLSSFQGSGMINRFDSTASVGLCGLNSSGMIQVGHPHNTPSSINIGKLQQPGLLGNPRGNLQQRMPPSLELDQLQQNKSVTCVGELSAFSDPRAFSMATNQLTGLGGSTDGVGSGNCSTSYLNVADSPLLLHEHQQRTLCERSSQQSSVGTTPVNIIEPFDAGCGVLPHVPDHGRRKDTWQNAAPLSGYSTEQLPVGSLPNYNDFSSGRDSSQCQGSATGINMPHVLGDIHESSKISNFRSMSNNAVLNTNYASRKLEDHRLDYGHIPKFGFDSPSNSLLADHRIVGAMNRTLDKGNGIYNKKIDMALIGQSVTGPTYRMQNSENVVGDNSLKLKEDFIAGSAKLLEGLEPTNCSSFDDLMSQCYSRRD